MIRTKKLPTPIVKNKVVADVTRREFEAILQVRFPAYIIDVRAKGPLRTGDFMEQGIFVYSIHRVTTAYYYNHHTMSKRPYGIILTEAIKKYNFARGQIHAYPSEE